MEYVLSFEYPNLEYFFVDNSANKNYAKKIREKYGVRVDYVSPKGNKNTEYMCYSLNRIVKYLRNSYCDYLFNNECDVFADEDVITKLLCHQKLIVNGVYMMSYGYEAKLQEQVFEDSFGTNTLRQITEKEGQIKFDGILEQVDGCGIGMMLAHRLIFEDYLFRINKAVPDAHADTFFYQDMHERGINIYRDNTIHCEHLNTANNWEYITDKK